MVVLREMQLRVEGAVTQFGDVHGLELHTQIAEHVDEQVVRQRAGGLDALEREGDGRRLDRPDPDGQVPGSRLLLEEHDRLVGGQLDPDPDQFDLDHLCPDRSDLTSSGRP